MIRQVALGIDIVEGSISLLNTAQVKDGDTAVGIGGATILVVERDGHNARRGTRADSNGLGGLVGERDGGNEVGK